ncbi:nicotinate phosphoribosyltransferase [Mortierella sp. NVP41]|nr:nicotinate phosphoribosyltransferase [Mortierella sp. NVP41]
MLSPTTTEAPNGGLPLDLTTSTTSTSTSPSMACTSILDNDLYKFTMQQAVRQHYPSTPCDYHFTNRSILLARLPLKALPWLKSKIEDMADLRLTQDERLFLERKCPYLTKEYLDWLQFEFRFRPEEQVFVDWRHAGAAGEGTEGSGVGGAGEKVSHSEPGSPRADASTQNARSGLNSDKQGKGEEVVEITIRGEWDQVILYEVPVLALVSEAYFRFGDQDWNYDGQFEAARSKSERLVRAGASFAEFGTRRRRDYETQRIVMQGLIAGSPSISSTLSSDGSGGNGYAITAASAAEAIAAKKGFLTGTSNLHFAHVLDLTPIGTMAHEWFMGTAAILKDASRANQVALDKWAETYPNQVLGIALTDTFTTEVFLKTFRGSLARDWNGVRHDSGDAFEFMDRMIAHYDQDPLVGPEMRRNKRIVFSDGLDTDLAIRLYEAAVEKGIGATFGIGTHFTNDYCHRSGSGGEERSKSVAMNIVIKLHLCAGKECVKLSDDHGKESGSAEAVAEVKRQIATL